MCKQQGAVEIPIAETEEESVVIIVLVGWSLLRRVTGRREKCFNKAFIVYCIHEVSSTN